MPIKVASNVSADVDKIVQELQQPEVKAVIYFFSADFESKNIHTKIKNAFPQATCIGASMIGGWSSTAPLEKGIVAMSLTSAEIDEVFVSFREGVKKDPKKVARDILTDLKGTLRNRKTNPNEYIGIILFDGLCLGEDIIKEFTTEKGFNIPLIGGAAADELAFKKTLIACDTRLSGDGALVMIMKMKVPFFYNHYVHYVPTSTSFTITRAEPLRRIVWEINGEPAAPYYAKLLGLSGVEDIKHLHFSRNPLGVVIGDTVYTRSPNAVIDGKGLQFYCFIEAGTKVHLLKQGDIIENARQALREAEEYVPSIQGAILFNCVLRYLEMKETNTLSAFNSIFKHMPFIGFNTYGEELFTHHNQTLTALFIGR